MNDDQNNLNGQNIVPDQNTQSQPSVVNNPVENSTPVPEPAQVTPEPVTVQPAPVPEQPMPTAPQPSVVNNPVETPVSVPEPVQVTPEPVTVQPAPVSAQPVPATPQPSIVNPSPVYNPGMPVGNQNYVPNTPSKSSKKILIIIGGVIGAILLLALIVIFAGKGNYKKTLSCDLHFTISGVEGDRNYKFYINDGEIAIKQTTTYNISNFSSTYYPTAESKDKFVQDHIESGENSACAGGACTYSYTYVKGKKFKEVLNYSSSQSAEILGTGASTLTADEIYTKLKTGMETSGLEGYPYTCK